MKQAIVTGSSSGIGKEISARLLKLGYCVLGISRRENQGLKEHKNYSHILCDLSDEKETLKLCERLKDTNPFVLVNCAGIGVFEPHEELKQKTIVQMSFLNLTAPMLLTNALLRTLKKNSGYVFNINSIEALRASKFAGVYSATKAGLKAFGDSLFEESRKSDLSVTNINPDMTKSSFYENLRFDVSDKENEKLYACDIADAVEHILTMRKGAVVSEYTIRSLNFGIKKK
jgi:short-subunit dehydrogenase